ncbi:unnamed protein product [Cuscuta europaea]|uniref:Uncharacterized protein n=1 Tax=Cuscuta europaea TaxID=41803 RepID=A0A9P0YCQ9_CUSEU|nr:unnamed protein product [Cuscuta europaea]
MDSTRKDLFVLRKTTWKNTDEEGLADFNDARDSTVKETVVNDTNEKVHVGNGTGEQNWEKLNDDDNDFDEDELLKVNELVIKTIQKSKEKSAETTIEESTMEMEEVERKLETNSKNEEVSATNQCKIIQVYKEPEPLDVIVTAHATAVKRSKRNSRSPERYTPSERRVEKKRRKLEKAKKKMENTSFLVTEDCIGPFSEDPKQMPKKHEVDKMTAYLKVGLLKNRKRGTGSIQYKKQDERMHGKLFLLDYMTVQSKTWMYELFTNPKWLRDTVCFN